MDWTAFRLSVVLALWTLALLVPFSIWLGRVLAYRRFAGRGFIEAGVALPLVLPPTVVGFYLLASFGAHSPLGQAWQAVFGHGLAFSFEGLLLASVLVNLPFAVQPIQNAFAAIPDRIREAGATSGMAPWRVFLRIELPLAWPGIATAAVLTFAHTLGEFGVVLMVGGSIPGETQTIAIAIYDRVQAFDDRGAAIMSAVLLGISVLALGLTNTLSRRVGLGGRAMCEGAGLSLRLSARAPIPLDLSFSIAPGELLALVGPSGAGKSTALRCIAGLHRAAEGRVTCAGATWFDSATGENLAPHRRAAGLVFQDYALFPHMTAAGNILAAMGHVPRPARAARLRELFAMVHLVGLEERRPAELSGGQQQRVAVARALARDPAILLLDEPFSAVDRATRRRLQAELVALRRSLAIPILLVTHDLEEALALADRMVVMHRGQGLQAGPPGTLLTRPANAEVARLLDLRNLFQGQVERHTPEASFLRWGGHLLEAAPAPHLPPGSLVDWLVAGAGVVLHRRGRPSAGERENPVPARVLDLVAMGEEARITLDIGDAAGGTLGFAMPLHAALRNGLAPGEACTVSLVRDAIHLMPTG